MKLVVVHCLSLVISNQGIILLADSKNNPHRLCMAVYYLPHNFHPKPVPQALFSYPSKYDGNDQTRKCR